MDKNFNSRADITSGENISYWTQTQPARAFDPLQNNAETEVLIIGGGISGLTTAYCLLKAGKNVILVEDGEIGSGESGRTTAHLTCALDDRYYELEKIFGKELSAKAAQSHMEAVKFIENTVRLENIECHFKNVDGYLFLDPSDKPEHLEMEYNAIKNAGIPVNMLSEIPSIQNADGQSCIHFPNQAQFHVMHYLNGLANAVTALGGAIYTHTKAEKITKHGAVCNGFEVKAQHIVVATNSPINDLFTMHTKQHPYRSYVIAGKIPKGTLPYSLWWDTGDQDSKWVAAPYHYVRLDEFDDQYDVLISGGEDHRTGQADDEDIPEENRYFKLEEWTRKHFPDFQSIDYRWSGQVMEPVDCIGFIGKNPGDENIYIVTGDSGNGMTHGTLGGIIITDLITRGASPYKKLYDPARISLRTSDDFIKETGNMAMQYLDWLTPGDVKEAENIKADDGAIISTGLTKTACYRDEHNHLHAFSAVCPHLGCIVQWNGDEKSFDCPCHGSRFDKLGTVMNGPATSDLKKVDIKEKNT